jgi:hypothetical protein
MDNQSKNDLFDQIKSKIKSLKIKDIDQSMDDLKSLFNDLKSLYPSDNQSDRITKKSISINLLKSDNWISLNDIALSYQDKLNDKDYDKNIRVARLWISKIGYPILSLKRDKISYYKIDRDLLSDDQKKILYPDMDNDNNLDNQSNQDNQ